uniref:Interleukin-12 subunit alpha-like n=1 Tax=Haplochromis burtoni TaxID=8153 RepID=A0A3Q2W9Y4_HAPBU
MPLIKLYFTPALLLLVLTCPLWQISQSVPLMGMQDSCVLYARTLLQNITDVLNQKTLFSGIDCTKQNMELYKKTSTPSACAPQGSACSEITTSGFDQSSCLKNIREDLKYYDEFLAAQPVGTLLFSLRELMKVCDCTQLLSFLLTSFDQRLHLCKVLKGFQVRAITINRVIAYMTSDEYTK